SARLPAVHAPGLVALTADRFDGGVHGLVVGEDPGGFNPVDAAVVLQAVDDLAVEQRSKGWALVLGPDPESEDARAGRLLHTAEQWEPAERQQPSAAHLGHGLVGVGEYEDDTDGLAVLFGHQGELGVEDLLE